MSSTHKFDTNDERENPFERSLERIQDGILGNNKGIPIQFPRLSNYWPYILRHTYYLVGAAAKIGKTSFVDDVFLYNAIDYCQKNPEFDCFISYLSLEIDATTKANKIICRKLFYDQGIELSSRELLSQTKDDKIDQSLLDFIKEEYKDFFELFNKKVHIKDRIMDVDSIKRWLLWQREQIMPDWKNNKDKYKNFYWIIIVDHMSLVGSKLDMDELSKFLLDLRNTYGAIPVVIQQLTFDSENESNFKNVNRPTPTLRDFADSKYTTRDANQIMALFSPHAYHMKSFDGFDIGRLGDSFRSFEIIRDRDGETGVTVPLYFLGKVGTFIELPRSKELQTDEQYKYYEKRLFLKDGNQIS
jgi:replicative DNA helicase